MTKFNKQMFEYMKKTAWDRFLKKKYDYRS